jgi:hypothetical protein
MTAGLWERPETATRAPMTFRRVVLLLAIGIAIGLIIFTRH